ncbi:uncharacterized protein CYBJADRAFT_170110, partial [Cyberlindnera jadinii NRRL Y-1542]
ESYNFIIGTGYDTSLFTTSYGDETSSTGGMVSSLGYITYDGPVPDSSVPSVCQACPSLLTEFISLSTSSSSSSSTTALSSSSISSSSESGSESLPSAYTTTFTDASGTESGVVSHYTTT